MEGSREITIDPLVGPLTISSTREEVDNGIFVSREKLKYRKGKKAFQWLMFICFLVGFIASLTIHKLENKILLGHPIWRWFGFFLVSFNGLLFSQLPTKFVVPFIKIQHFLKEKVLGFIYGQKNNGRTCIWLLIMLTFWFGFFGQDEKQLNVPFKKVNNFITWTFVSMLIGSFLRVVKTLLLKSAASSFGRNISFDKIRDSIFQQYVLFTLSGPPVGSDQMVENVGQFTVATKKGKDGREKKKKKLIIDIRTLNQINQVNVSTQTMEMLLNVTSDSCLTIQPNDEGNGEITNEEEAIAAASRILQNVARNGFTYIEKHDLKRFIREEDVDLVFPIIDVGKTGQINRETMVEWVVNVYKNQKALAHALNNTKSIVMQLNKLISLIMVIMVLVVWLLLTGISTIKMLILLTSQLVLCVFIFGNTLKTTFECIVFVFMMHTYDVGDCCFIDDFEMVVQDINILTTVFLKSNGEKVTYPNSLLSAKWSSNFSRSPYLGDSIEFSINFKTPNEKLEALKEKIKEYMEKNRQHWHPNYHVIYKEFDTKIKMSLLFNYMTNFQDSEEKTRRKTSLAREMKIILEELNIECGDVLLPQEGAAT